LEGFGRERVAEAAAGRRVGRKIIPMSLNLSKVFSADAP
jgi:hypothetical protein